MFVFKNRSENMMNRSRNLLHNTNGVHNSPPVTGMLSHRRARTATNDDFRNNMNGGDHLFSRNHASSDQSDLQVRLARLTAGSSTKKPEKSVILDDDDILLSNEQGGKHDYDWLLTPPETPLILSSEGKGSQPTSVTPKRNSAVRSGSTIRTSRLSVSPSESSHLSRPARSSSVTRPSVSTTQYTNNNRNSNILSTSSASVSSYVRPSSPTNRSSSLAARPSPHSSRTTTSRASTPSRTRPSSTFTSIDRTARPSTPTHRPHTPANLTTSPIVRPSSRPSTPTRRSPTLSHAPSSNGRSVGPASRPSSPSSRVRPSPQPINLPDFPHETPPNLRTTLPERPLSAGRSRPGAALTVKGHLENTNSGSMTRRQPSPIVTRGRIADSPGRGRPHGNGHVVEMVESRRTLHVPESITRKPIKMLNSESGTGFGRSISKKSLDMAIKHMGGATHVDIACDPELVKLVTSLTRLPVCVSSVDPSAFLAAVEAGASMVEIGNYDSFYDAGIVFSPEQILNLTMET